MIINRRVPDAGLEDLPLYSNRERLAIMKVATCPKLFPCSEVIGWILPRADVTKMIFSNTEGQGYAAYSPSYVTQAYKLPMPQNYLAEGWLKDLNLNILENVKRMMVPEKKFVQGLPRNMKLGIFALLID